MMFTLKHTLTAKITKSARCRVVYYAAQTSFGYVPMFARGNTRLRVRSLANGHRHINLIHAHTDVITVDIVYDSLVANGNSLIN
jgi:hypothetical protein